MRERPVPNRGGKIMIRFPSGLPNHEVDNKDVPDFLLQPPYEKYDWVNFVILDQNGNPVHGHLPVPYKVMLQKVSGKEKIVCWNGIEIVELKRERDAKRNGHVYAVAKLDLGDPPVAWG